MSTKPNQTDSPNSICTSVDEPDVNNRNTEALKGYIEHEWDLIPNEESNIPSEIYKFMTSEGAIKTILNRSLRISDISKLNDPYDMMLGITDLPNELKKGINANNLTKNLRNITSRMQGVLCFSGKFSDPTMWAHYADNHRGMCLVFNTKSIPLNIIKKVTYTNDRRTISYQAIESFDPKNISENDQKNFFYNLSEKSTSWSYEDEYRIILEITDHSKYTGFYPITNEFLKRVIIGLDCTYTPENVRCILDASGYKNVSIEIGVFSQMSYEVAAAPC